MDWYSFSIYFSVFLFSSIFSYGTSHSNSKNEEFIGRTLVFFTLLIPAILRYNLGADYPEYADMFYNTKYRVFYAEKGFNIICDILLWFNLSSWWMFFLFAFGTYFTLCYFIKKDDFFFIIVFYVLFSGYFRSIDQIRQSLALPFILLAMYAFSEKKLLKSIILIVIASLFHTSSLLFLLLIPIASIPLPNTLIIAITAILIFITLTLDLQTMIFSIIAVVFPKYMRFADSEAGNFGSGLGLIANTLFPLFIICQNSKKSQNCKRRIQMEKMFSMMYIILFFMTVKISIFNRLRDLVWCGILYAFPNINNGKYKKVYCIFFLMIGLMLFVRNIQIQQGQGTEEIVPYVTIFEK